MRGKYGKQLGQSAPLSFGRVAVRRFHRPDRSGSVFLSSFLTPLLPPAPRCICGSCSQERTPLPSLRGRWSQTLVGGEEAAPPLQGSHAVRGQTAFSRLQRMCLEVVSR